MQPNDVDLMKFQTMNSVWSNILSLRYQVIAQSGCKDIGIRNFEFVAKTQFLSKNNSFNSKVYSNHTSYMINSA